MHTPNSNHSAKPPTPPLTITLTLPGVFVALCHGDQVQPGTVLQGFVADLCGLSEPEVGYLANGEQAGDLARWSL